MDNGTGIDAKTPEVGELLPHQDPEFDLGDLTLMLGGIAYALLCLPAIGQRGYPPIDPFWIAIPFLWPLPLILSSLIYSQSDRSRLRSVAIYAFVTAFFDSGTFVGVVPHHVNPVGMLLFTVVGVGPFHLLVAYIIEFFTQLVGAFMRSLLSKHPVRLSVLKWSFAGIILIGTVVTPFAYRAGVFSHSRHRARQQAEQDWRERKVCVFKRSYYGQRGNVILESQFDFETGFPCEWWPRFFGYEQEYNQRITELIAERGYPAWGVKDDLRSVEMLPSIFRSKEMKPVEFPYELSTGVNLAFVSQPNLTEPAVSLKIVGPQQLDDHRFRQHSQITKNASDIVVGQHPQFPNVVFVRMAIGDDAYVEAYHRSGWLLYGARPFLNEDDGAR